MIVVIDYDVGNVGSVHNMLRKVGVEATISRDHDVLRRADKLVLPGVGAFDEGVANLQRLGLRSLLDELVLGQKKPVLGVCLGAQLMCRSSEEGNQPGLGWLDAQIRRFEFAPGQALRIPHMGWNTVSPLGLPQLFDGIRQPMRFYFVHSYYMVPTRPEVDAGHTTYGFEFTSVLGAGNIAAVQFHPEKSHSYGLQFYRNFVERFQTC